MGKRVLRGGILLCAGVVVALALVEGIFWLRDSGAFPHLNRYVPDAELGVRLAPSTTTRVRFNDNPVTQVRINAQGYRGEDLPPPQDNEIVVVGDSQVFGLGVEEGETFSAQLAELSHRPVVNAGVPTYGPEEYLAVAKEMLAARHPKTVVFTINMVNDLFEARRPNKERHKVLDGWAVRIENYPAEPVLFPGRGWLFGDSHVAFALRKLGADEGQALPSEGTWRDVLLAPPDAMPWDPKPAYDLEVAYSGGSVEAGRAMSPHLDAWGKLVAAIAGSGNQETLSLRSKAEEQRSIGATADELLAAAHAAGRDERLAAAAEVLVKDEGVAMTPELLTLARRELDAIEADLLTRDVPKLRQAVAKRDKALADLRQLRTEPLPRRPYGSVLGEVFGTLADLVAENGADAVVLILPIDVQVHADEWKKYGASPRDMSPTLVFNDVVAKDAEQSQLRVLDARQALVDAYPGVFLDGDIHLTPKGHKTVALALAKTVATPPLLAQPSGKLPPGRTRAPSTLEWRLQPEIIVKGSTAANCETLQVDEWVRIGCTSKDELTPTSVVIDKGGGGEGLTLATIWASILWAPLERGDELEATFTWTDHRRHLVLQRDASTGVVGGAFGPKQPPGAAYRSNLAAEAVNAFDAGGGSVTDCARTYPPRRDEQNVQLKYCVAGELSSLPTCPVGQALAGGTFKCFALCDAQHPCQSGTCAPWPGAHVCR